MSPDLEVRAEVNQWLQKRDRQSLSVTKWCELFSGEFESIAKATSDEVTASAAKSVLAFAYEYFGEYTGLAFSKVRPNDSLNRDLNLALVCWFDWTFNFCDDFLTHFDLDLSDCFDEADFMTIGEMVEFLVAQVVEATETSDTAQPSVRPYLQLAQPVQSVAIAA